MNEYQARIRRENLIRAFVIICSLGVLAAALLLPKVPIALANTPDINNARTRYPNIVGTSLDSCSLCHTSSIPNLNPYGADYKANGRSPAALAAIEGLDSDGDGFSNLTEIMALSFPGNSASIPAAPTATMTPMLPATNTPTATSTPLPTSTPTTAPTATKVPPTSTPVTPPTSTPVTPPTSTPVTPPTATKVVPPTATQPPKATMTPEPPGGQPSPTPTIMCTREREKEYDKEGKEMKPNRADLRFFRKYKCWPIHHDGDGGESDHHDS